MKRAVRDDKPVDLENLMMLLSEMLHKNDLEAERLLDKIVSNLEQAEQGLQVRSLEDQVRGLDFAGALETLGGIADKLGIPIREV